MANFPIPDKPEYKRELRMFEPTDRAHSSTFNTPLGQLLENDIYLNEQVEKIKSKVESHAGGVEVMETDIPIADRKRGVIYLKVTEKQSVSSGENLKVSPNMGIKIMEGE